jgi:hypothetical protein
MEEEFLMLVPKTADDFLVNIGALPSLDEGKVVSFHTISLPEERCARLLSKNLGMRMPRAEIRKELETLHIIVQTE